MAEGYFESVLIGTFVEKSVVDKFKENLNGISPADAIKWFVNEIATGEMRIEKVE